MSNVTVPQALQIAVKFHQAGQFAEAEQIYRQVLQVEPNNALTLHLLGSIAHQVGKDDIALQLMGRSIELEPNVAWRYNDRGEVLRAMGRMEEAIDQYRTAIRLDPSYALAYNNMGIAFAFCGQLDQSIASFQHAIRLKPDFAEAHNNLGNALQEFGRLDEAIPNFENAIAIKPDYVAAHDNLLMTLNYHDRYDAAAVFAEHQRWESMHAAAILPTIAPHANNRNPDRRIRVGYVSPDFREHAVCFFFESLIANHDHAAFEVFCYSDSIPPDDFTARLQGYSDHWRHTVGMMDDALAQLIRQDQVDILVDLAGHTSKNRMMLFARKPAPVQVTYLGYPNTTGLKTMDYRITDAIIDPPGVTEHHHTEQLIRLPGCFICYRPPAGAPDVGDLPALGNGYVTFGSFNRLDKFTPPMLSAWSRILHAVPESHLVMKANGLGNEAARTFVRNRFIQMGIDPLRLDLRGREFTQAGHLGLYNTMDIALDTFPYNGTTTTCEAMWMGVPVITLAGQTHVSRVSLSLLSTVGLAGWVAHNPDDYVNLAVERAKDLQSLSKLRATLRDRVKTSPLTDAPAIARNIEREYREIWRKWCEE